MLLGKNGVFLRDPPIGASAEPPFYYTVGYHRYLLLDSLFLTQWSRIFLNSLWQKTREFEKIHSMEYIFFILYFP